ncbi:PAS domain-containing protein [Rhizobium sp. TRM95111]|uniref:ATP-binding protein n=1 Tax=Rhizobium alarense TaxID=2846851 RepID=UPI001F28465C|nr:ATP-binding protein [Rhizobium alarense]MCF3643239.1 PAS domain-containing protein [Rhizobium alarense]
MGFVQSDLAASLCQSLPFPVLVVDSDCRTRDANEAASRALKLVRSEDGGSGGGERHVLPPDRPLAELAAFGSHLTQVLGFRRPDGSTFEATAHVIALTPDATGPYFALVLRSIVGGGSHTEEVLLGERISAALDTIPEGFAIFDPEERLVMFNKAFRDRCGAAASAVRVGVTLERIVRANLEAGVYDGIAPDAPGADVWVAARLADHRHGTPAVFAVAGGRWMRAESHMTAAGDIVALWLDVSDIKRAELALEAKRREYLSLLQNLPDMICRFTPDRIIRFCNDKYAALYGRTSEAMIGTDILNLVPPEFHERTIDSLAAFSRETPTNARDILQKLPDGSEIWVQWDVTAVFAGDRLMDFLVVGRDVTDAKAQRQRLAEQREELERKNLALDQFTATVSHDLKAPLRHLSMFADMLIEDIERQRTDELAQYAEHIRQSSQRMRRLVDSLLDYAQIAYQIVGRRRVDLREVVDEALLLLESHVLENDAEIEIGPLPAVSGDPDLLVRLAQNLIGNALKYHVPGERARVRIYGRKRESGVDFVVEDSGIGIDPRRAARIFDVFQRLHRDESTYKGTGIGLALAKRIVESHNAVIALDTDYRPGARFVVTFPETSENEEAQPWEMRQRS